MEANVAEAMAQAISDILIWLQATSLIAHSLCELALDTADGSHLPEARRTLRTFFTFVEIKLFNYIIASLPVRAGFASTSSSARLAFACRCRPMTATRRKNQTKPELSKNSVSRKP